jgi:hypothetical protein
MTPSVLGGVIRRFRQAALALTMVGAIACGTEPATSVTQPGDSPNLARSKSKISVTTIVLASSIIAINNPGTTYSITMKNTDGSASLIFVQAVMEQGTTSRASGGANVLCGAGNGVLPHGSCTMDNRTAFADEFAGGTGTFAPGPATLIVTLNQFDGTTTTVLDSQSIPVTLVAGPTTPYITNLTLASTTFVIGGPSVGYTISIWNPGASESLDVVQALMIQGSAFRGAGGRNVACGTNPSGTLPHGNCSFNWTASVSNSTPGPGTLVPGAATFRLELSNFVDPVTTLRDFREIPVTLKNP